MKTIDLCFLALGWRPWLYGLTMTTAIDITIIHRCIYQNIPSTGNISSSASPQSLQASYYHPEISSQLLNLRLAAVAQLSISLQTSSRPSCSALSSLEVLVFKLRPNSTTLRNGRCLIVSKLREREGKASGNLYKIEIVNWRFRGPHCLVSSLLLL